MFIWIPLAILFFCIGAWPISIGFLAYGIYTIFSKRKAKEKEEKDKLQKENEALRQELAEQAVRHAMDKAESREKKD